MKSTNDNPLDPLGSLGAPIKPTPAAKPDPAREFEKATDRQLIGDTSKAQESIAEALRPKATVTPGAAEEWQGLDWPQLAHIDVPGGV